MPTVIPVKFHYASRELWFDPNNTDAIEGDHLICETERGLEIGLASSDAFEVSQSEFEQTCSGAPLRPVKRIATGDDLIHAEDLADKGDSAMPIFRHFIHEEGLDMKPVGVEYLFDNSKVVCYFCADERIDFRQLVRELSRELHQRIDMRQIGVREEAAMVGGFGHCGQELCCCRFGHQFEPVSIRMAKEQDLPLNSSKISGACGRLMCCLRYEFEAYRDFKQRAPKRNAVIDTPLGKAKIVEYDTPKEQLALRLENGKTVRVPLADMQASDAAKRKSADLGCPCRPDTVTRTALEKLQSVDVQMALAELDRKNGVIPEESFDESDIFVDQKPKQSDKIDQSGQESAPRHRRRHKEVNAVSPSSDEQAKKKSSSAEQGKRRKRHPTTATAESVPEKTLSLTQTPHHRRHHNSAESREVCPEPANSRQTRHPGDHGGATNGASTSKRRSVNTQTENTPRSPRRRHHRSSGQTERNDASSSGIDKK
jgi:cell fate regulator YaaT (PSP1 superfamily)